MKKLFLFLTTVFVLAGCSIFEVDNDAGKSVDELVAEGSAAFMDRDYVAAVKAYTDLKDWYPFSKYASLAELKIADSYYHLGGYEEAIMAYEEFERMHPKNEAVPYVIFQVGMCWFDRLGTIDRDNMPAEKSLEIFKRLADKYPQSEYTAKTKDKIQICKDNLSGHELYVGNWYMKTKRYASAIKRYEYLLEHYPNSKDSIEASIKIDQCKDLINSDQ